MSPNGISHHLIPVKPQNDNILSDVNLNYLKHCISGCQPWKGYLISVSSTILDIAQGERVHTFSISIEKIWDTNEGGGGRRKNKG
jgi:hypothetical protein